MKNRDRKNGKSAECRWRRRQEKKERWKNFWQGNEENEEEKERPVDNDRQEKLEKAFSYVESEVGNMSDVMKSMQESVMECNKAVADTLVAMKDRIDAHTQTLDDHEETLNEHEERIVALEKKVGLKSSANSTSMSKPEPASVKPKFASAVEPVSEEDPGKVLASVSKQIAGEDPESAPAVKSEPAPKAKSDPAPVVPVTEPEPVPVVKPEPAPKAKPIIAPGFTGKGLVFLIHDKEGSLNTTAVFESSLVAKWFDPNYEVAPAWFEDGKFVRTLTADEAVNIR